MAPALRRLPCADSRPPPSFRQEGHSSATRLQPVAPQLPLVSGGHVGQGMGFLNKEKDQGWARTRPGMGVLSELTAFPKTVTSPVFHMRRLGLRGMKSLFLLPHSWSEKERIQRDGLRVRPPTRSPHSRRLPPTSLSRPVLAFAPAHDGKIVARMLCCWVCPCLGKTVKALDFLP